MNDQDIQKGVQAQVKNTSKKPIDPKMVQNSFELNKGKAKQAGLDPVSPDYWAKVAGGTSQVLGIFNDDDYGIKLSTSQRGDRGNQIFQRESYISFEEELKKEESPTPIPKKANRIEAAKELIKRMKGIKSSRNEIINSIVNRLRLSVTDAIALYDGKEELVIDGQEYEPTDPLTPPGTYEAYDDVQNSGEYELNKKKK